jgi:hypothetical protein
MQFPQPGKEASAYGRRGAVKSTMGAVYRIEGENVTMVEIAQGGWQPRRSARSPARHRRGRA